MNVSPVTNSYTMMKRNAGVIKEEVRQAYTLLLHRKATSEAAVDKPLRLYTRGAA